MNTDNWSTLPDDLLVNIFRRLDVTAVIRCAVACRPWRRAIIDNASCFGHRPDRFLPDLPLGFLESPLDRGHLPRKPQYVPASKSTVPFLVPATGVCVDGRLYSDLFSSRDGFLLLGDFNGTCDSLCLFTAYTGNCRIVPGAYFDNCSVRRSMYVLATRYDVDNDCSTYDDGDETAVWILAVDRKRIAMDGSMTYQIFSSTSGEWGPVKCSKFPEDDVVARVFSTPSGWAVVCDGAISWLVCVARNTRIRTCLLSVDLRTERTWMTELPCVLDTALTPSFVLAVSENGRLSLVKMLRSSNQMEVWVLVGDGGQWTLRRTIDDVQKLLPDCSRKWDMLQLSGFCPRSGYLFGTGTDDMGIQHHFLIGVDGSSPRVIERAQSRCSSSWFSYEMDWSMYISSFISRMKYF